MFDDVVIIHETKHLSVDWFIKGPRIASVFFGEKFFQYGTTVFQLLRKLSFLCRFRNMLCRVR